MLTGIVQEVINLGVAKGSGLKIDGVKYGVYDPVKSGIDIVHVGDEVSFEWSQKGQYKNINGRVTKTGNTGTPAPLPATPAPKGGGAKKGGWGNKGVFPIPADDGQRSIIRQNSVTNAVAIVKQFGGVMSDGSVAPAEEAANQVIEVAQIFEEYSAGDLDAKLVAEAVAAMNQTDD